MPTSTTSRIAIVLLAACCFSIPTGASAETPLREVALKSGMPIILAQHDQDGRSDASGGIALSGNWRSVSLNLAALPPSYWINAAVQTLNGQQTHTVGFYRHNHERLTIDAAGVVSSDEPTTADHNGPYIAIAFHRGKDYKHQIQVLQSQVTVTSLSGSILPTEVNSAGEITVGTVPDKSILVSVAVPSKQVWTYKLFPYLRAVNKGIIEYNIVNVPLTGPLVPSPE